tara:strand:- start:205 stop:1749 length:1545 start_codon:yes stop_codon:yes gene_type:complete
METIEQTISGSGSTPTSGTSSGTVTISRNGDLVHKVFVKMVDSGATGETVDGTDLISEVELEIGGQRIDRHKAEWLKVWNELTTPESKAIGLKSITGGIGTWGVSTGSSTGVDTCLVPLQFWFCRNPGLALPLIALQYHEVKLKFTWGASGTAVNCTVFCDYIYLDTDERRRFAQVSHEYLIEQLQYQSPSGTVTSEKLNFNHPVKELIWVSSTHSTFNNNAKLILNGHDRFSAQPPEYFQLKQTLDYHTAVPRQNLPNAAKEVFASERFINLQRLGATQQDSDVFTACSADEDMGNETTNDLIYYSSTAVGNTGGTGNVPVNALALNNNNGGGSTGAHIAAALTVGLTIAIVISAGGTHAVPDVDVLTSTGTAAVGDVYFARVLEAGVAIDTGIGAAVITPPTTIDGSKVLTNIIDATTNSQDGPTVAVYKATVTTTQSSQARTSRMTDRISVYSFALKPEEHQPSGTCNFSRIDNAKLDFSGGTGPTITNIYAVNYNVLRIMSGMGGLAYSN